MTLAEYAKTIALKELVDDIERVIGKSRRAMPDNRRFHFTLAIEDAEQLIAAVRENYDLRAEIFELRGSDPQ